MKTVNNLKYFIPVLTIVIFSVTLFSCSSNGDQENKPKERDTVSTTDETEMIEIEEVEMESMYEVTNTKTHKTTLMSQEEYLESAIWENPDCVIKEVPVVK